jgi:hypothetical protein
VPIHEATAAPARETDDVGRDPLAAASRGRDEQPPERRRGRIVNYNDVEIDYDKDGDIEIEYEEHDGNRGRLLEHGKDMLQDLDRAHVLDGFGR